MFEKFVVSVLAEAAKNDDIRNFVADQVSRLKKDLLPDIVATFPAFGASLLKAAFDKLPDIDLPGNVDDLAREGMEKMLESDPDIPGLSNIIDLSEIARRWLGR